ncbi:hypothetical protein [Brevibacillus borstelensis]|uniref:hypothetical protein n=1 Tax=Brevibacillus borstelensis TaxID=45462 RepID=UPI003CF778D5
MALFKKRSAKGFFFYALKLVQGHFLLGKDDGDSRDSENEASRTMPPGWWMLSWRLGSN